MTCLSSESTNGKALAVAESIFNTVGKSLKFEEELMGAASLLLENDQHPEFEIDKVTTPRGVTISGLNQMEHDGFSSAMIKGIVTSATKAEKLYEG